MRKELIVIIKEQANDEVVHGYTYYESKQLGLGDYFLSDFRNMLFVFVKKIISSSSIFGFAETQT